MDNVYFLYYHKKKKLPQKNKQLGNPPPFSKMSRWPILPHQGGVKWVTYLFLKNIGHYLIPSEEQQRISEKQVT